MYWFQAIISLAGSKNVRLPCSCKFCLSGALYCIHVLSVVSQFADSSYMIPFQKEDLRVFAARTISAQSLKSLGGFNVRCVCGLGRTRLCVVLIYQYLMIDHVFPRANLFWLSLMAWKNSQSQFIARKCGWISCFVRFEFFFALPVLNTGGMGSIVKSGVGQTCACVQIPFANSLLSSVRPSRTSGVALSGTLTSDFHRRFVLLAPFGLFHNFYE